MSNNELMGTGVGVSGPTGVLLRIEPEAHLQKPSWTVAVQSAYFAGLPGSCCGCTELSSGGPEAQHISQVAQGLNLAYSFATGTPHLYMSAALRQVSISPRMVAFSKPVRLLNY